MTGVTPEQIERAVRACFVDSSDEDSLAGTLGFDETYAREVVVPIILNAALTPRSEMADYRGPFVGDLSIERLAEIRDRASYGISHHSLADRRDLLAEVDRLQKKLADQGQREAVAHLDLDILKDQFDKLDAWWRDRDECERANWQAVVDRLEARVSELELTAGVGP